MTPQYGSAALYRLAIANAHRPKLWMCPDCHVRFGIEKAPSHADTCEVLQAQASAPVPAVPINVPVTTEELDYVLYAASLRGLTLVEYVRRAINLSLRKEGVDAVLLRESDDDE